MPPHNAYILLEPDTYYFRPYNVVHIAQQQKMANRWGEDPRHPYTNELFQRVYEAWEAQQVGEETLPETPGTPAEPLPDPGITPVAPPEDERPPEDAPAASQPPEPNADAPDSQSRLPGVVPGAQSHLDFIAP